MYRVSTFVPLPTYAISLIFKCAVTRYNDCNIYSFYGFGTFGFYLKILMVFDNIEIK